jgi:hypothetical protein
MKYKKNYTYMSIYVFHGYLSAFIGRQKVVRLRTDKLSVNKMNVNGGNFHRMNKLDPFFHT